MEIGAKKREQNNLVQGEMPAIVIVKMIVIVADYVKVILVLMNLVTVEAKVVVLANLTAMETNAKTIRVQTESATISKFPLFFEV